MIFNKSSDPPDVYRIDSPDQLALLDSSVRYEILAAMEAADGPLTVTEMARELGRPADGLYYHVDLLVEGGLLREVGRRETRGRAATLYGLPGRMLAVRYPLDDPEGMEKIRRMASEIVRVARREFEAGTVLDRAEGEGEERNLWVARVKSRLSPAELGEVTELLERLREIFGKASRSEEGQLVALTWLLSPIEDRPPRRDGADRNAGEAGHVR